MDVITRDGGCRIQLQLKANGLEGLFLSVLPRFLASSHHRAQSWAICTASYQKSK